MRKILSHIFILLFFKIFSQDNYFVNGSQALMFVNPSFAGSNGGLRVQNNVQSDFSNSKNFITSANSVDFFIKKLNAGVAFSQNYSGVNINPNQWNSGSFISNYFSFTYAQHLIFKNRDLKIIPSIQISAGRVYVEPYTNSIWQFVLPHFYSVFNRQQYVLDILPTEYSLYGDISSGLLVNYKRFYFGFSAYHIMSPQLFEGSLPINTRYSGYASYNLKIDEGTLINFSSRFESQNQFNIFQIGANAVLFKHFMCGLSYLYNSNNAPGSYQYYPYDFIGFNLGYRHNFFSLSVTNSLSTDGLHLPFKYGFSEMTLSFNLRNKEQRKALTNFETW